MKLLIDANQTAEVGCGLKNDKIAAIFLATGEAVFSCMIFNAGNASAGRDIGTCAAQSFKAGVVIHQTFGNLPKKGLLFKLGLHGLNGGTSGGRPFQSLDGGKGEDAAKDDDPNQGIGAVIPCACRKFRRSFRGGGVIDAFY